MEAEWIRNKSLYICTSDHFKGVDYRRKNPVRYRVQVIKLSDLLSFSDIPITVFSSGSKSKSSQQEDLLLREVDFIDGDLPTDLGFGLFGSRIVLAGGSERPEGPNESYVLETDPSVEPMPRFIGTRSRECQPHYAIPEFKGVKPDPLLVEIKGKLYALAGIDFSWEYPAFEVFDPETKLVAEIMLPNQFTAESYSCAHLGGRKVCFLFMDWKCPPLRTMTLYAMTFEFLYSESGAIANSTPDISSSSASDPYFLHCNSICGSFSAKPLGSRFFIYDGTEESLFLCSINLGGCFVL